MATKRSTRAKGRGPSAKQSDGRGRLTGPDITLDAEDIALARLQAHLRKTEAIHPPGSDVDSLGRTSVRLPGDLLRRARQRARRDGRTISELVASALESFLEAK